MRTEVLIYPAAAASEKKRKKKKNSNNTVSLLRGVAVVGSTANLMERYVG